MKKNLMLLLGSGALEKFHNSSIRYETLDQMVIESASQVGDISDYKSVSIAVHGEYKFKELKKISDLIFGSGFNRVQIIINKEI